MIGPLLLLLAGAPPDAGAATTIATWDLEDDDGAFTLDEILPVWEWGQPTTGPAGAYTGTRVWGTNLDDFYINNNEASLQLSELDLSSLTRPVLKLWHWYRLRPGDEALLEAFIDDQWQPVEPIYGYPDGGAAFTDSSDGWQDCYVDLTGLGNAKDLRLTLISDATGVTDGWYLDDLSLHDGDVAPPHFVAVDAPSEWERMDAGPTITAQVEDDVVLSSLLVRWSTETIGEQESHMAVTAGDAWSVTLPALEPDQTVTWSIEASDGTNLATWPKDEQGEIRVFLPAPTDLTGPTGRTWGTSLTLDWAAPDSVEALDSYRVYRDGELVAEVDTPPVEVPAVGPTDSFTVTAVFDTDLGLLEGDPTDPLLVEIAVPLIDGLSPDLAYQGDLVRVELSGEQLLLEDTEGGAPILDLGAGVSVVEVEVVHVDKAAFTLAIDPEAATGLRDAVLTTGGIDLLLADAFEVADGAERPTLISVEPASLEQGASGELAITASTDLGEDVIVDLGQGIVVEDVRVEGAVVVAAVVVANDATVGSNTVVIDDGRRILQLEDGFRVYARASEGKGCQTAPTGSGLLLLLPLLGWRRRSHPPPTAAISAGTRSDPAG